MEFLKSAKGNISSSRLIVFIIILASIGQSYLILYWGRDEIFQAATAAGVLWGIETGSALYWMFSQKKQELNEGSK